MNRYQPYARKFNRNRTSVLIIGDESVSRLCGFKGRNGLPCFVVNRSKQGARIESVIKDQIAGLSDFEVIIVGVGYHNLRDVENLTAKWSELMKAVSNNWYN